MPLKTQWGFVAQLQVICYPMVIPFFTFRFFVHIVGEQRYQKWFSGSKSWLHKIINVSVGASRHFSEIDTKSRYQWKRYLMLYLPLRFHPDPFIRVEVTGHNSIQCISWGYGKLQTLQITKLLVPSYLDLLKLLTWFHAEITHKLLQCNYESF